MNNREKLKNDIESFIPKAIDSYNNSQFNITPSVNKSDFLTFEKRFHSLTKDEFESAEKYKHFSDFVNQEQRLIESDKFKHLLQLDYIKGEHFSSLINYLIFISDRLK